jgi:hypothetical protein
VQQARVVKRSAVLSPERLRQRRVVGKAEGKVAAGIVPLDERAKTRLEVPSRIKSA